MCDNAYCREGKGTGFARNHPTGFLREHHRKYGTKSCILKYDIRHFSDSIGHEIIKGMLKAIQDRHVPGFYSMSFGVMRGLQIP